MDENQKENLRKYYSADGTGTKPNGTGGNGNRPSDKTNQYTVISIIFGILALCSSCACPLVGIIFSIASICFGTVARKNDENKDVATLIAIIIGIVALVVNIAAIIVTIITFVLLSQDYGKTFIDAIEEQITRL